jgi:hypothetical protein
LAGRAEFNVIREELIVDRTRAALDDNAVSLQHETRNQSVFTKQACEHNKQAYEHDEDHCKESAGHFFAYWRQIAIRDFRLRFAIPVDANLADTFDLFAQ